MKCAGGKCSSGPVPVLGAMPLADVRPSAPQTLPLFRSYFKDTRFSRDAGNAAQVVDLPAGICMAKAQEIEGLGMRQRGEEACNVES